MYIQGKPSIIVGAVDQLSDTPEQNVFASNSSGGHPTQKQQIEINRLSAAFGGLDMGGGSSNSGGGGKIMPDEEEDLDASQEPGSSMGGATIENLSGNHGGTRVLKDGLDGYTQI